MLTRAEALVIEDDPELAEQIQALLGA